MREDREEREEGDGGERGGKRTRTVRTGRRGRREERSDRMRKRKGNHDDRGCGQGQGNPIECHTNQEMPWEVLKLQGFTVHYG